MKTKELIAKLNKMIKDNPKAKNAKIEIEYNGGGGCETCGYGSERNVELEDYKIYDLDTRIVFSVV